MFNRGSNNLGTGSAGVSVGNRGVRAAAGVSLASGTATATQNIGPFTVEASVTARIGVEYGIHGSRNDAQTEFGFSKKFFSGSLKGTKKLRRT